MSQKSTGPPTRVPAEKLVRDIRRATRKHHSAEDRDLARENERLRREVRILKEERDILKKATQFFASQKP